MTGVAGCCIGGPLVSPSQSLASSASEISARGEWWRPESRLVNNPAVKDDPSSQARSYIAHCGAQCTVATWRAAAGWRESCLQARNVVGHNDIQRRGDTWCLSSDVFHSSRMFCCELYTCIYESMNNIGGADLRQCWFMSSSRFPAWCTVNQSLRWGISEAPASLRIVSWDSIFMT